MYPVGEYDLAGFAVGCGGKSQYHQRLGHQGGRCGDRPCLERRAFQRLFSGAQDHRTQQAELNAKFDGERTLADCIMAPTRIYVKPLLALMQSLTVKGMAHITGGGLTENVPRVLPENVVAAIDSKTWQMPKLFHWLREQGNVAEQEMYRTFNCGIGMVVIVAKSDADAALAQLNAAGETATIIAQYAHATATSTRRRSASRSVLGAGLRPARIWLQNHWKAGLRPAPTRIT